MKKIITFIIILNSIVCFSQNKSETENWIVEKYNDYERSINKDMDLWFEDGYLFYYWTIDDNPNVNNRIAYIARIKIKDIKKINTKPVKWNSEDKIGWSKITIYCNEDKLFIKDLPEESTFRKDAQNFIEINMESSFIKDGVSSRMEKAFLHLIKLYGGIATIKKEAF